MALKARYNINPVNETPICIGTHIYSVHTAVTIADDGQDKFSLNDRCPGNLACVHSTHTTGSNYKDATDHGKRKYMEKNP